MSQRLALPGKKRAVGGSRVGSWDAQGALGRSQRDCPLVPLKGWNRRPKKRDMDASPEAGHGFRRRLLARIP